MDIAKILENKELLLYEDEKVAAFLSPEPAAAGHIIVAPREKFAILEQVPDFLVAHLFTVANKLSTTLFEALQLHGTNILVQNGTAAGQDQPWVHAHIIPRSENDGIGFAWEPLQLEDDKMNLAEHSLREQTGTIGDFEQERKVVRQDRAAESLDEDNYLTKQLKRVPGRWM